MPIVDSSQESSFRAMTDLTEQDLIDDLDLVEPIAIIGFSLKFPQDATSPEAFWDMMAAKRDGMTEFPSERINIDSFYHPDNARRNAFPVRGGHFIEEDLAAFDAKFFSITPAEAAAMDPAQRILLETTFRALENSGIPLERLRGSDTAVYTGCFSNDYLLQLLKDPEQLPTYAATGASLSMLANRLSWFFDLSGPSVNFDSACSSSAMALDQACRTLQSGQSSMALVAGCNLSYSPEYTNILSNMNFLSPESRCFTFDNRADGYSRGEGIGVVVLKKLSQALQDQDTIRALIRSTGCNQDGHTAGITQPSSKAQERLMKEVYSRAGLSMKKTRFFEAHGTGTPIGDPTEISAIAGAFGRYRTPKEPLYVGAVKTNIGHLEGASGIAGLIKTILILETGYILPNTNFHEINTKINLEGSNIKLPLSCTPWPCKGLRRASINSFGFGGSNCHVVLDDAFHYITQHGLTGNLRTAPNPSQLAPSYHTPHLHVGSASCRSDDTSSFLTPKILVWSASDQMSLQEMILRYQNHCSNLPDSILKSESYVHNLAYTLDSHRSSLKWKSYVVLESSTELKDLAKTASRPVANRKLSPSIAFIFTGQGAQWHAMGRELFTYPVFEQAIQDSQGILKKLKCPWSIRDELHKDESYSNLNQPEFSQPLCVILQIGLVELLKSFGVIPSAVVGHSSGEIAAAYCSGALSLESAVKIAYYRGVLASSIVNDRATTGGMMAVNLSSEGIGPYFDKVYARYTRLDLVVSCVNSPSNITVGGETSQIDMLKELLDTDGVFASKLQVTVAYHSPQMNLVADTYRSILGEIYVYDSSSNIQMVSSVTGSKIHKEEVCEASYWVKNMVSTVQFMDATLCLCSNSTKSRKRKLDRSHYRDIDVDEFIEIGPHAALRRPIQDIIRFSGRKGIGYSSALYRNTSASRAFVKMIGYLHCLGVPTDLRRVNTVETPKLASRIVLTDLPEYPFNHTEKHWHESRISTGHRLRAYGTIDLLGCPALDWNPLDPYWRYCVKTTDIPWVEDHKVNGKVIYPAAAMVVMALEAARQMADQRRRVTGYTLRNAKFQAPLEITTGSESTETRLCLRALPGHRTSGVSSYQFVLYSLFSGSWTENCNGIITVEYDGLGHQKEMTERLAFYQEMSRSFFRLPSTAVETDYIYKFLQKYGLDYGPSFQCMKNARYTENKEASASIEVSAGLQRYKESDVHVIHPTALDSIIQLTLLSLTNGGTQPMSTQVVTGIDKMWISEATAISRDKILNAFTKINMETARNTKSSFFALSDDEKELRLIIEGLEISSLGNSVVPIPQSQLWCHINTMIDIDSLNPIQTQEWLEQTCGPDAQGPRSFHMDLNRFLMAVLKDLQRKIRSGEIVVQRTHLKKYSAWIDWQLEINGISEAEEFSEFSKDALISRIKEQNNVGRFFFEVAKNAPGILRGETDVLQLLFADNLVNDYYAEQSFGSKCFEKMQVYLDTLAHKRPNMRVLELGAGTGSFTNCVLHALSFHAGAKCPAPRYDQYFFTDISPSFFEKAKSLFSEHGHKIVFKTLDIEKDCTEQGFEQGSFDIITASNVLHVTENLARTVQRIRKLLKPGGKLIFHEIICPTDIKTGFAFGLLPGWWLGTEAHRTMGPTVTESTWNKILSENGYSGADFFIRDYAEVSCQQMSIIVSTALDSAKVKGNHPATTIVIEAGSSLQSSLANNLRQKLLDAEYSSARIVPLDDFPMSTAAADLLIMLVDIETPILARLNEKTYTTLKSIMLVGNQMLWVRNGDLRDPGFGMMDGFARVLRIERNRLKLATLALEDFKPAIENHSSTILHVVAELLDTSSDKDLDYLEKDGILNVSRISEDAEFSSTMLERLTSKKLVTQKVGTTDHLKVEISVPGKPDTLRITQCIGPHGALQPDEIEVEVQYVGLNAMDSSVMLGRSSASSLGSECAGTITAVGSSSSFLPGDRVCMFGSGVLGSAARTKQNLAARIPEQISFCTASILPQDYLVASYLVHRAANLTNGQTVLIHGGYTSMNLALADLCLKICRSLFITMSSDEDENIMRDMYGHKNITFLSSLYFSTQLQRLALGKGIDVVIDSSLDGPSLELMDCLSSCGNFIDVDCGRTSPSAVTLSQIPSGVTYRKESVLSIIQDRLDLIDTPLQALVDTAVQSRKPNNKYLVFKLSQVEEAFAILRDSGSQNRVVIDIDGKDQVSVLTTAKPAYSFDYNSSYLIAGGLGDLGMCVAKWMAQRGAKNLILLSRRGCCTEAAGTMLAEMKTRGVSVSTPRCDITDKTALKKTLIECSKAMPPIKGCVQTSAALKDIMYEKMTFEDWNRAVNPKVIGSWNLHELLPKGMDFFIMASSISGILGQTTQLNYAAGNTYQDSLARFRVSNGEKAVSLDLGILTVGGLLGENPDLMERLTRTGCYIPISEEEILCMFDYFCDPTVEIRNTRDAQIIVGIKNPLEVQEQGHDVLDTMRQPLWSQMFVSPGKLVTSSGPIAERAHVTLMEQAGSLEEISTIATSALSDRLSRMLAMPKDGLNVEEPLHVNGVDSLSAVDLRNWITKAFGVDVPVFDLLGDNSIDVIGKVIANKWQEVRVNGESNLSSRR